MNSKQRSYLRKMANDIQPIFQIGKGGIGDNTVNSINEALEARELIKLTILRNSDVDTKDVADEISFLTNAEVISVIGRKVVLYKESEDKKTIKLP